MMFRTAALLLALVALVPSLSCGGGERAAPEAEFVYAGRGEVTVLDPNRMSWMQDIRVGQAIFEGLYRLDPETLDPVYGAAEAVEVSDDGLTYTCRVRPDAKWSNGDDLTAGDFAFAWRRNLREWGDYSYLVGKYVKGADAYRAAYETDPKTADFSTVGIEVVDAKTIRVTLENPTPYFPDLLAFVSYWPLNERAMAAFRKVDPETGRETYSAEFTQPANLVGNGAYALTNWQTKVGVTLTANPHYWDADSVKSRTVRSLSITNPTLAFQKYEAGEIDWLTDLPGSMIYDLKQQGRADVAVFPSFGTYFYSINCQEKLNDGSPNPFADARVRRAVSMAVDKRVIVDEITKVGERPSAVYVPRGDPSFFEGYEHPDGLPYDVEAARKLLADAGYPEGKGFPSVKLLYNTDTGDHAAIAQNVRRQWQDKLGIVLELDGIDNAQFKSRLHDADYAVSRASWYGDYMDVSTFTDKYLSDSDNNDSRWKRPEYDALLAEATREADPQKRLDLLSRAEAMLLEDAPILPLYQYTNSFVHRPDVTGIPRNARMMIAMHTVATPRSTGPGANVQEVQ